MWGGGRGRPVRAEGQGRRACVTQMSVLLLNARRACTTSPSKTMMVRNGSWTARSASARSVSRPKRRRPLRLRQARTHPRLSSSTALSVANQRLLLGTLGQAGTLWLLLRRLARGGQMSSLTKLRFPVVEARMLLSLCRRRPCGAQLVDLRSLSAAARVVATVSLTRTTTISLAVAAAAVVAVGGGRVVALRLGFIRMMRTCRRRGYAFYYYY